MDASHRSDKMKGTRLGPYEVVRVVGHGATASVFEGRHVALGKAVAIKILHEHLSADEQVVSRFLREGRVAARLSHPNSVEVLDVGVEDGMPYLVMELLEGGDLRKLLGAEHLLPVGRALAVLLPIASALAYAHDQGGLHRDLKPANIFLARDVRGDELPKLVDFGLSKVDTAGTTSSLTESQLVAGTALYMAPEQTHGVKNSSPASDQYSLAAILYECVTGEAPFKVEGGVYALFERIRTEIVRPPSHLNPGLPEGFDDVLLRAMRREPTKRYPSIRAFGRALLPFADGATARVVERDFLDRASARVSVESRPSLRQAKVAAPEGSLAPAEEPKPEESRLQGKELDPLPCPPGESPFHIKGMPYRGLVQKIERAVPGGLDAFCDALPDARLRPFVRQQFLASARYDILPFVPLCATLARLLGMPFEDFVRRSGVSQAHYDAKTVFRTLWATAGVEQIAERIGRFSARYYDFGTYTGSLAGPNVLEVVHAGFPTYLAVWYVPAVASYTEEAARMLGGKDVTSTCETGSSGSRAGFTLVRARLEIRWR